MSAFAEWIEDRLNERNWSRADLARSAKITQSSLSLIYSGERNPGADLCEAIARAFRIAPEVVFRAAGILPPKPDTDPWLDEMNYRLQQLTGARRSMAERLLKGLEEEETQAAQADQARPIPKLRPAEK